MAETPRSKIKGRARPDKPKLKPLSAEQSVENRTRTDDECNLGRLIMAWSRLESALQGLLWEFAGLAMEDGRILTSRVDAGGLVQMLRALARLHMKVEVLPEFLTLLNNIDEVREIRNLAAHGLWHMLQPGDTPAVMSLRIKVETGEGDLASETFPEGRLARTIQAISAAHHSIIAVEQSLQSCRQDLLLD